MTNWPAVLLEGSVGGVVGALSAFGAAVWVSRRQLSADRFNAQQRREQEHRSSAEQAMYALQSQLLLAYGHRDAKRADTLANIVRERGPWLIQVIRADAAVGRALTESLSKLDHRIMDHSYDASRDEVLQASSEAIRECYDEVARALVKFHQQDLQ